MDFSVDENFSDRDTFRSLTAGEARGKGCVAEFVRPDSGGQKWTLRRVSGAKRVDPHRRNAVEFT